MPGVQGNPDAILAQIVAEYIRDYRDRARAHLEFYRSETLGDAIEKAGMARWLCGNKHPHQHRFTDETLREATEALLAVVRTLGESGRFGVLYDRVEREIIAIRGIHDLAVYDIAHRIGAHLGLEPELVYLHRGTKEGAAKLGFTGKAIHPDALPAAFQRLSAEEIEDCLCIFKGRLPDLRPPHKRKRAR